MNDAVVTAVWMPANGLLLSAAWFWARRLFPRAGGAAITIHVIVVSWACIVANTLALGAMGILSPVLLLASVCGSCVVGLVVLWVTRNRQENHHQAHALSCDAGHDPESGAGERPPEGGTTNSQAQTGTGNDRRVRGQSPSSMRWWMLAWGLMAAMFVARVVFDGLLAFPSDWDTLAYHVPLVDHWIREGSLYVPNCAFWYSPGNNELVGLWFVAPFSGDFLIALNNLPAVILMPVAAVELVASFGVSRHLCHLAGMAIMATEVTWRQMVSAENDLAVAGLFLATLVYGVRYARGGKRADVEFQELQRVQVGTGDVLVLRISATTSGDACGVSLRLTDLQLRADTLPDKPTTLAKGSGGSLIVWLLVVGGIGTGGFLLWRYRLALWDYWPWRR